MCLWLLLPTAIGCGDRSGGVSGGIGNSLFQSTRYPVRAVLVDDDQEPVFLESLSVYAGQLSAVRLHLKHTIEEYEKEIKSAQDQSHQLDVQTATRRQELRDTERDIQKEYESRRPKETEDLTQARNPLKELSRIRAEKSSVDNWFKSQITDRVDPIKAEIESLEEQSREISRQLSVLRAGFYDRLFSRLDTFLRKKHWKTSGGSVTIEIPNDEPWVVWATASHNKRVGVRRERSRDFRTEEERNIVQKNFVRWLSEIPRDLDSNQTLHLDYTTALERNNVAIDRSHSDGPFIRVQRR